MSNGLDWERVHREATIIDLHIHPSMKQQLFNRRLGMRYFVKRTTNIFGVQSSFPRLKNGGYDAIFSVLHVPEKGVLNDFPIANLFRILRCCSLRFSEVHLNRLSFAFRFFFAM